VLGGESARGQGNALQLVVDPTRPEKEFLDDWTAVHELSHLLHPYLGDRGSWLGEGLATYYQNVLRARAGLLTPTQAWQRLGSGFHRGQSGPYAESLEQAAADMSQSHSFLRVYWAGAAYWLTVDAELRRLSRGKQTLDTALSRFGECCLPAYREWKPEEFVAKLDAVLHVKTFTHHYREFARMKQFPDWQGSFARLGVQAGEDSVVFDEGAADAWIRTAITAPRASPDLVGASKPD
jgi:predicted metalloprotease with PDZ domain